MDNLRTADWLLLGGAVVAGYFIYRGAKQLYELPERLADKAATDAYNIAAGVTNSAGLTNTQAGLNEAGSGMSIVYTSPTTPIYTWENDFGYGTATMQDTHPVSVTSTDWIPGFHLW